MPCSSGIFDDLVGRIINLLKPHSCLDVGTGAGKYGQMIKKYTDDSYLVGVEIERDYIKQFNLEQIYDEIRCIDAATLIDNYVNESYDLVIIGDTIEHLRKSDGIDLLHFLVYRAKFIIVIYPIQYLQNSVDGYKSEAHISVWDESDFLQFNNTGGLRVSDQELIVIDGYLSDIIELRDIMELMANVEYHDE